MNYYPEYYWINPAGQVVDMEGEVWAESEEEWLKKLSPGRGKFYIETICGGNSAMGGGCGAPRGVREVSKETFDAMEGIVMDEPCEHCAHECSFETGGIVKVDYSPCGSCFNRY